MADELLGSDTEIKLATGIADIYREANAYEVLAMHYAVWGNEELRDKYIDLAINAGMDDESIIYYRSCQGRTDLISPQVITRQGRYAFHRTLQTGGTRGSQSYGRVHAEQKRRADAKKTARLTPTFGSTPALCA